MDLVFVVAIEWWGLLEVIIKEDVVSLFYFTKWGSILSTILSLT